MSDTPDYKTAEAYLASTAEKQYLYMCDCMVGLIDRLIAVEKAEDDVGAIKRDVKASPPP